MTIATNLSGVFYCSREAIPHLPNRGGYITNLPNGCAVSREE